MHIEIRDDQEPRDYDVMTVKGGTACERVTRSAWWRLTASVMTPNFESEDLDLA